MHRCLSEPHATILGANTVDDERWGVPERCLHATLALLFQLLLGRPELQPRLASDRWLRTLASVLHAGSNPDPNPDTLPITRLPTLTPKPTRTRCCTWARYAAAGCCYAPLSSCCRYATRCGYP